jgi:hypothetical protein
MQFDRAGELIIPVRWYFVPDDTPFLPFPHLFGSNNYQTQGIIDLGPGERWDSPRFYSKGAPPGPLLPTTEFCGPLDWWANGVPSTAPSLPTNTLGQALCCIEEGGLIFGGTSQVATSTPNEGGLYLGGTSLVTLTSLATGGLLLGGTSVASISTGGLILGGTVLVSLVYPYTGGLILGGTSYESLIYTSSGGLLVGGESLAYRRTVGSGGLQLGGISAVSKVISDTGGVELGGTSHTSLIVPCQLWNPRINPSRTLYRVSTATYWTYVTDGVYAAQFNDSGSSGQNIQPIASGSSCLGYPYSTALYLYPGPPVQVPTLISYNATTYIGTYKVPSTSPVFPGEMFQFYNPP